MCVTRVRFSLFIVSDLVFVSESVSVCLPGSFTHLKFMFVPQIFTIFTFSIFVNGFKMDVSARTTMKAAAKCEKHCELHDSVNH